jgi:glycerol-3-phosphate dehydrogenase
MYDIAIIGAGVIGANIARELSRYNLSICLIEKENDVSMGTTKANSAIIHSGYDAKPGTLKGKFNALGNPLFDKLCDELNVPFKRIGSMF